MLNRKNFLFILTGIFIVTLLLITQAISKKDDLTEEKAIERIEDIYERELSSGEELQEQVRNFSVPANVLKLFHENEERLNAFVQHSCCSTEMEDSLSVEYIDGKRCYFYSSSISGGNKAEINSLTGDDKYEYMILFMDYAIDSGLVFRDWMLDIHRHNPVNEENAAGGGRYWPSLSISIYRGYGMEISLEYFANQATDNSEEDYEESGGCIVGGGIKRTRINSNWYYSYHISEMNNGWRPDLKDLAFSEEFYSRRRTTAVMRHILTENLRGFLRLYWEYGLDFKEISWWDLESLRWTEWYIPEPVY